MWPHRGGWEGLALTPNLVCIFWGPLSNHGARRAHHTLYSAPTMFSKALFMLPRWGPVPTLPQLLSATVPSRLLGADTNAQRAGREHIDAEELGVGNKECWGLSPMGKSCSSSAPPNCFLVVSWPV